MIVKAPLNAKAFNIDSLEKFEELYNQSIKSDDFFLKEALDKLFWEKKPSLGVSGSIDNVKWFEDGQINLSRNCLDRHLETRGDHPAIIWEGEPGDKRTLSYRELYELTCKVSTVLKKFDVEKGDRVLICMPMVPELVATVLACARIGAVHSVVFAGFSAKSIADRTLDCQPKLLITEDIGKRKAKNLGIKAIVDEARTLIPKVMSDAIKTLVFQREELSQAEAFVTGQDFWFHEMAKDLSVDYSFESLNSEDPLFILYTSGSTGKPKGIFHTQAGYALGTQLTSRYLLDLHPEDVYFCTADIGWITGHSYIAYGPLQIGCTCLIYEGAPMEPSPARWWEMIDEYGVNVFYTAPTAIRAFMQKEYEPSKHHDLSSLRVLGTVGEPINPEAWNWYRKHVGHEKLPIVDTWWQTETGAMMISPLPGVSDLKPGSAVRPFLGVDAAIVDENGKELPQGEKGYLVVRKPWPSMLRGVWGDRDRFIDTYFAKFKEQGYYFTGDGARIDEDGFIWLLGRIDDVLNVSGHRIGTAEVESALVSHPIIAEAAVVGFPHDVKGEGIFAFVLLEGSATETEDLEAQFKKHVRQEIGAIGMPDRVVVSSALPKTRSGKIMRRILKDLARSERPMQDVTTLENPGVVEDLCIKLKIK